MSPEERIGHITKVIAEVAREVAESTELGADDALMDAGMDSLAMVEFGNRLSQRFALTQGGFSPTLIFDYPTCRSLAGYFDAKLFSSDAPTVARQLQVSALSSQVESAAIVSMACRFPGHSSNPNQFWENLAAGVNGVKEIPHDRWDVDAYYDGDPGAPGKTYARAGGFIEDVDLFDNNFFGISSAEAQGMDPQQRLLLEVGYEALYKAGYSKASLSGSNTGVFVGACMNDWTHLKSNGSSAINAYSSTGNPPSLLANRLSYLLGLHGPSMTIDTACSSSLIALHSAMQSLQLGECRAALVVGVNLMLSPATFEACTKSRMLSLNDRCATFDASADGYARGEGCGAVLLKRLDDAGDGDQVIAVVRGSAAVHNGRSATLTAPNGISQQMAIHRALLQARIASHEVSYVEAHGTGTALGDPIEVGALKAVYGEDRDEDCPLVVGALKTNIGHLEGAAGIAGLIKAVLVLQHQAAPSNLHFSKLNPAIDVEGFPVVFPCEGGLTPLKGSGSLAGVSSFGFGGANAHLILERGSALSQTTHDSAINELFSSRQRFPWREPSHALLQHTSVGLSNGDKRHIFSCSFGPRLKRLLSDHVINGRVIVPGTTYIEAALGAIHAVSEGSPLVLKGLRFLIPLEIADESGTGSTALSATLCCSGFKTICSEGGRIEIRADSDGALVAVCSGEALDASAEAPKAEPMEAIRERCPQALDVDTFYDAFKSAGFSYGAKFKRVESVVFGSSDVLARVEAFDPGICEGWELSGFMLHPAILDCALQTVGACVRQGGLYIPSSVAEVTAKCMKRCRCVWVHAQLVSVSEGKIVTNITITDSAALEVYVHLKGFTARRARGL
ncbi:unnamed protein product, partial [Chrysoparadoxa australica]